MSEKPTRKQLKERIEHLEQLYFASQQREQKRWDDFYGAFKDAIGEGYLITKSGRCVPVMISDLQTQRDSSGLWDTVITVHPQPPR